MKKLLLTLILCIYSAGFISTADACGANEFCAKDLFPQWSKEAKPTGVIGENGSGELDSLSEKGETQGILLFLPKITNYLLFSVASIIIVIMIYAGVNLIIAQGNDEEISKAKKVFHYSVIGFIFAVTAYTLVRVVYEIITKA